MRQQHRLRSAFAPAAVSLALFLGGCDGDLIVDPDEDDGPVQFDTLFQSGDTEIEDARGQVIETDAEWADAWDEIGTFGQRPLVNFDRDMVILLAAGEQPDSCHEIDIRFIELDRGVLEVDADHLVPSPSCVCSDVVVRPVHVVRVPRIREPVDFNVERVVRTCR